MPKMVPVGQPGRTASHGRGAGRCNRGAGAVRTVMGAGAATVTAIGATGGGTATIARGGTGGAAASTGTRTGAGGRPLPTTTRGVGRVAAGRTGPTPPRPVLAVGGDTGTTI